MSGQVLHPTRCGRDASCDGVCLARSGGVADLVAVAGALARCPSLWSPLVSHAPDQRVHLRLAAGPHWEAYLITWPSGHGVDVHDHGGSAGAVAVVEGDLVELVARPAPRPLVRRPLAAGTVRPVPRGRIHDVVNGGNAPATSIHVYGPALQTMTFYDDDLRPVRTERVFPEPPQVELDAVRAALRAWSAAP